MNIILTGFMGSGKSTVAKALARDLKYDYVEMDDIIEQEEKISINEIFKTKGERYFRDKESEVAEKVSKLNNTVVSTGGGVVLRKQNMDFLRANGKVFFLHATPEVIYKRIKDEKHRPLLKVDDPLNKINELLNEREKYYENCDHKIEVSDKSVDVIINEIKGLVKNNE